MSFFIDFDRQLQIQSIVNQIAFTLARCECNVGGCPKCEVEGTCESFKIYQLFAREILANSFLPGLSFTKEDILKFEKSDFMDILCSCLSDLCLSYGGENTKKNVEKKSNDFFIITLPRLFVDTTDVKICIHFSKSLVGEEDDARMDLS